MKIVRFNCIACILAVLMTLVFCAAAMAQDAPAEQTGKKYYVYPFKINGPDKYAYLSQGIQSMLSNRLAWSERNQPAEKSAMGASATKVPASLTDAMNAMKLTGMNHLVWGDANIMGDNVSLDVSIASDEGKSWKKNLSCNLNDLIPQLETLSRQINEEVFNKPAPVAKKAAAPTTAVANPEFVYNEPTANQQFYLNPNFKYEGGTEHSGRWRSQRLPFTSRGMAVGDADGKGVNEIFFLTEMRVYAYRLRDNKLEKISEYKLSGKVTQLNINLYDINRDGTKEIFVSGFHKLRPWSTVLTFKDDKLELLDDGIGMFFNVIQMPPNFTPTLIGMKEGNRTNILHSKVRDVIYSKGKFSLGKSYKLPIFSNVFNIGYLPTTDGQKVLVVDDNSKIRVYGTDPKADPQFATDDPYARSQVGIDYYRVFPGMSAEREQDRENIKFWIPERLIVMPGQDPKNWELIVSKNISVSASFMTLYRNFAQSEIHSLVWDGVGLVLKWKTRRIKGGIVDYHVMDFNGDGKQEMVVCLNTHSGMTGTGHEKTILLSYGLEMGAPAAPKQ